MLHDDVQVLVVPVSFKDLDYVWMVDLTQGRDFLKQAFWIGHVSEFDGLHSDRVGWEVEVMSFPDRPELAIPNDLAELVVLGHRLFDDADFIESSGH